MNLKFCALITLATAVLLISCNNSPEGSYPEHEKAAESPLALTWEAHGGLNKWNSYRTLGFTMESFSPDGESNVEVIVTDLENRRELISGDGYLLGFDGKDYWQSLSDTSIKEKNVKFQINLQFYFFAMPFVLSDPGVILEEMERESLMGKEFKVVKASFSGGTGVAPEDQYLLYIDPVTNQLEVLLYSVTYFDSSRADKYSALHYTDWQEFEGLLLPIKGVRYQWDKDTKAFGPTRGRKEFGEVSLAKTAADDVAFMHPEK